jgi:hypothetical protein
MYLTRIAIIAMTVMLMGCPHQATESTEDAITPTADCASVNVELAEEIIDANREVERLEHKIYLLHNIMNGTTWISSAELPLRVLLTGEVAKDIKPAMLNSIEAKLSEAQAALNALVEGANHVSD